MTVLKSLLSTFQRSRNITRKSRRVDASGNVSAESLEQRLLLTNPDFYDSNPNAPVTIYLDFDAYDDNSAAWAGRAEANRNVFSPRFDLDGNTSNWTASERDTIEEIYLRVAEDFSPFDNVTVTTIEPVNFNVGEVVRVAIGGDGDRIAGTWSTTNFNNAFLDGFTDTTDSSNTVFVFPRDYSSHPLTTYAPGRSSGQLGRDVAYGVSEAVGIAMGLTAVSRTSTVEVAPIVNTNNSDAPAGWRDVWSDQNGQDDIAVITSPGNNITVRPDDHGSSMTLATPIPVSQTASGGFIETNGDVDFFQFSTSGGATTITVSPELDLVNRISSLGNAFADNNVTNPGANLNPTVQLFDANGNAVTGTVRSAGTDALGSQIVEPSLPAGVYFVAVSNDGEYGNLGAYSVDIGGVSQSFEVPVPFAARGLSTNLPAAPAGAVEIYLDFNGGVVTEDSIDRHRTDGIARDFYIPVFDLDGDKTSFSSEEEAAIREIRDRVAEDFAPFNINVTTSPRNSFPTQEALQIIIGGDGSWLSTANTPLNQTGTGFIDWLTDVNTDPGTNSYLTENVAPFANPTIDNVAIAFPEGAADNNEIALAVSSIALNTFGVEPAFTFDNAGVLTGYVQGQPALGPIGGDSVTSLRDILRLSDASVANPQDPVSIITDGRNEVRFRADDHGQSIAQATSLDLNSPVNQQGIIGRVFNDQQAAIDDQDWFRFRARPSTNVRLTVEGIDLTTQYPGATNPGANFDPVVQLFRDNGTNTPDLIAIEGETAPALSNGTTGSLRAEILLPTLDVGDYFVVISNQYLEDFNGNPVVADPAQYGNYGAYTFTMTGALPPSVELDFSQTTISENDGRLTGIGRVSRPAGTPDTVPIVVDLVSSDTSELSLPVSTVTIPAGVSFVDFDVDAVDDNLLDGDQNVQIDLLVGGSVNSVAFLSVLDHETISVSLPGNQVKEPVSDTPEQVAVTVTRSNIDTGPDDHWVAFGDQLVRYDSNGIVQQTLTIPAPNPPRPNFETAHDIQVLDDGRVAVFNGTDDGFLTIYNPSSTDPNPANHWLIAPFLDSSDRANASLSDVTAGGLTTFRNYVFVADLDNGDGQKGILRFDVDSPTAAPVRFGQAAVGARLFAATGNDIQEINAQTGELIKSIPIPPPLVGVRDVISVAFDGEAIWVLSDIEVNFGFGFFGFFESELLKLDPDTEAVLETHALPGLSSSNSKGMTLLDDRIYINDPTGFGVFSDYVIKRYNPTTRQFEGSQLGITSLNDIYIDPSLGAIQADNPADGRLLVLGMPKLGAGLFSSGRIYEINLATGLATVAPASNIPLSLGVLSLGNNGVTAIPNVTVGGQTFDHVIYVNGDPQGIQVLDRNGTQLDTNPSTGNVDLLPNGGFVTNQDIGGGDVPGLITADQSFRDLAIGLHDDLLYGLFEDGTGIAVYNPETLAQLSTISLENTIRSLTVGVDGLIYGGGDNGMVYVFDTEGTLQYSRDLGIARIGDIEVNVSLAFLASDENGQVVSGTISDLQNNTLTQLENTGLTSFISFARNPDLPSGDLFVNLTSSDLTEIGIPAASQTVVIPEGQQSVTVMVDVLPDQLLDGTQQVTLVGAAEYYVSDSPTVSVLDGEQVGVDPGVEIDPITNRPFIFENDLPYPSAIRIFRTDLEGPFTVASTTVATASAQSPTARPVFSRRIDDNAVTTSTINIPTQRSAVTDLNVTLQIEHEALSELTVVLISPNGTRVELFANPDITGTTLSNTTFDDEAARSLSLGTAPYNAIYRPSGSLATFDQENPSGDWTLEVTDNSVGNTGVLLDWSLDMQTPSAPLAIVDRDVSLSEIVIPAQNSVITDIDVTLTMQHSFVPDMDVFLVSPQGTRVELFTDLGSNESDLTNTILDDEAAIRIVDGTAPFTGRFIAEELLSKLDGENPSGRWTLEISDDNITDSGILIDWSLDIETLGLAPATVTVVSNDPSEVLLSYGNQVEQASVQVTFPAATSELFVDLIPQDDQIVDGVQQANVSVSAVSIPGFDNGSATVDVMDVENLSVSLDRTVVSEAAGPGAITGTIFRSDTALTSPLIVSLMSSDTTELMVPATVTIPAGQASATFLIDAVDDVDLDGDIFGVVISAEAPGYIDAASPGVTVTDQEPRLELTTFANPIFEDDGTISITVSRIDASDLSVAQSVTLVSSDPTALSVPANFLIPIGQISATFTAIVHPDDVVDGPQVVSITTNDSDTVNPTVSGDTLDLTILDSEAVVITVAAGDEMFSELAGTTVEATITLTAIVPNQETIVTLSNSDLTELSIPAQVVIPAGESTATFTIQAVDDARVDRDQLATITGASPGYLDGNLNVTVLDHEPPDTLNPLGVTEDSTPAIQWGAVDGATRYDLWINDVSRNIVQLYRLENLPAGTPFFSDDFESGLFSTNGWSNSGATIDDVALDEQNGSLSARLNGSPDGGDTLTSPTFDLSASSAVWGDQGQTGVQLRYSFQQTGGGESPEASEDLVVSYLNAAGEWIVVERQNGSGPDMTVFQDSTIYLPAEALHENFAVRFDSIGKATQPNVDGEEIAGEYDDWFIDNVELTRLEQFVPPQELGIGTYRFWVRAYDSLEQPGAWSQSNTFRVRTRPVFINPTNNQTVATVNAPVLSWTTIVDSSYDLWVNDVTRGISQVIRETNLQTTSFATSIANLPGGTYKAWVRGEAPDGLDGFWSTPVTFTILSSPTGLRPTGSTFDRTPEFGWNSVEGADRYYLWVTKRNPGGGSEVVLRDQFVTGTTRLPEQDLADGNYVMWVQAIAEDGTRSQWSAGSTFTIGGRPIVTSPANGSTVSAGGLITWTGIAGAVNYELWINRTDVAVSQAVYDPSVETTSFQLPTTLAAGEYRVWIRAMSDMGERSGWSLPVDFTVVSADESLNLSVEGPEFQVASTRPSVRNLPLQDTLIVTGVNQIEAADKVVQAQDLDSMAAQSVEAELTQHPVDETEVDSIMAEWGSAGWWSSEEAESESDSTHASAALLGLGLASRRAIRGRRRKGQQEG